MNCGELLSKWVGESTKNIDAIFEESRNSDAILVFDEAEGLFGSRTPMRYGGRRGRKGERAGGRVRGMEEGKKREGQRKGGKIMQPHFLPTSTSIFTFSLTYLSSLFSFHTAHLLTAMLMSM